MCNYSNIILFFSSEGMCLPFCDAFREVFKYICNKDVYKNELYVHDALKSVLSRNGCDSPSVMHLQKSL